VKARALENRIPVVSPNFLSPPKYPGSSMIVDFKVSTRGGDGGAIVYPSIAGRGTSRQASIVAELDLDGTNPYRTERLRARRPDTYADLLRPPV
jgi:predicted amidohydrolase